MNRIHLRKSYFDVSKQEDINTLKKALLMWKNKNRKRVVSIQIYWQIPSLDEKGRRQYSYERIRLQQLKPARIRPMPETTLYYDEYRWKSTYQSILGHIKDEYEYARYLDRKEAFDVLVAENSN